MAQRYDVLVVGGGPAGSTTALRLARAGASVVLVDKARFPRDKPCGGGLTLRAVHQCPVDPTPVVEDRVDTIELRFRYGRSVTRSAREPLVWMTQRRRLDLFLLDAAREAGVEVREQTPMRTYAHRSDVVVGADGANGTTARLVGLGDGIYHGVAFEGNVRHEALERDYHATAVVELGEIPGGYGWVFPKGDHVNVGVGGWGSEGPRLRAHLARLCERHGIDATDVTNVRGHRLPLRRGARIAAERALLVGDAAGLVDPVSGDGMYECFVSSRLAAEAILDLLAGRAQTLAPYEARVDGELAALHSASWKLKGAFDRFPRAAFALAASRPAWRCVEHLLQGRLAHPGEERGLARAPMRALALLGR